jgi:acetyl esterase/lipase
MKIYYLLLAFLIFILGFSREPENREINPDQFSGMINLNLNNGVWRESKGKIYYQDVFLDLLCESSLCTPKILAYAPRFQRDVEYIGTLKKIKITNAWKLTLEVNYAELFPNLQNNQQAKATYIVELIPHQGKLLGSYVGELGDKTILGKIQGKISDFSNLKANYQPLTYKEGLIFSLEPKPEAINNYIVHKNINYLTVNNHPLYLDIYQQKRDRPSPTLIAIHGGGWFAGTKSGFNHIWPYLEMGFSVVSIQYRLADIDSAPAAVEDCLCALNWVVKNSANYNIDPQKIVLAGGSAGGHLALITGMINHPSPLTKNCPIQLPNIPKVAAIVNWLGPTDLTDLVFGKNQRDYALRWFKRTPQPKKVAKLVSPIDQINRQNPPILSIHGDKDTIVPYDHAVRLHQGLTQTGIINGLITLENYGHGSFSAGDVRHSYMLIELFLRQNQILNNSPLPLVDFD